MRSKIFKSPKRRVNLFYPRIALAFVVFGLILVGAALPAELPAQAATGVINNQINYQGRLLNAAGAVVADGTYNIEFKIYKNGDGLAAGDTTCTITDCASTVGSLLWTEDWLNANSKGVTVKNGYFSVALGSITSLPASFNESVMWLSINIAGSPNQTSSCTPFSSCTGDGEMLPMKRMSAAPYALQAANANLLGGIAASGFAQLAASQTFTAANIFQPTANVTGLVVKQNSNVSPTADIFNAQTFNGTNAIQVTGPALNEAAVTIQSVGATRDLTLQSGSGTVKLGSSTALNANAALTISSGAVTSNSNLTVNANGTGTLALDTTGAGTVNVATASETVLGLGNNSSAVTIASNATLNIGNNGVNKTINVGVTGATANTTTLNLATSTGAVQTVNIGGTNTTSATSNSGSVVNFQGGATGFKVANAGVAVQTYTNSATAFQVQDTGSVGVLTVDTINRQLAVRGLNDVATLGATEQVQSQNFTDVTKWTGCTGGTNWTGTITTTTHVAGNTVACVATSANMSVAAGTTYLVSFQLSGNATETDTVTVSMGGVTAPAIGQAFTNTQKVVLTTTSTAALTFTPTTNFSGQISAVSVKILTNSGATLSVNNSNNSVAVEVRTGGSANANTAIGVGSLRSNTTGSSNTALGYQTLLSNTTAFQNTALGALALQNTVDGSNNTAIGYSSLVNNTSGFGNTVVGENAMISNTVGFNNTAVGVSSMNSNLTGVENAAFGRASLSVNTVGTNNAAFGDFSLNGTTTGAFNVGVGYNAGTSNTIGSSNTFVGNNSGSSNIMVTPGNLSNATAIGNSAQVQGSNELVLGGTGTNAVNVGIGTSDPDRMLSVAPSQYNSGAGVTATQSSNVVTASSSVFTAAMIGSEIIWANGGAKAIITGYGGGATSTTATVSITQTVSPAQSFQVHYLGLQVTSGGLVGVGTINPTANLQVTTPVDTTTAFQVQEAGGNAVLNVDTANQQVAVRALADAASLGLELVTSQAFNTASWTTCNGGAGGWSGTATTATHNTGNTVACSAAAGNFTVVSGTTYQVTYQLAGNTTAANTVTASMGGVTAPAIGQTGTNTQSFVITATSTAALTFTPTTSFNGVISSVSVKVLTIYGSALAVNNGSDNTVALEVRTGGSGKFNTAIGANALRSNISGSDNTVLGYDALRSNTTGNQNTAFGSLALTRNTAGIQNTALGYGALTKNTTGSWNNALGYLALSANTTGGDNSAIGYQALQANTAGTTNIAMGTQALNANTTGSNNTGLGVSALFNSVTGSLNTALGSNAGTQLSSGSNNTFIGAQAGGIDTDTFITSNNLTNATAIGYQAVVQNSSTLVLGGTGGQAVNVGIGTTVPINTLSVSPVHYSTGTAGTGGVSSATITGVGTAWNTAGNVSKGDEIIFADGQATTVTGITSDTSITVFGAVTEAAGSKYRIHYMGLQVTSAGRVGVGTSTPSATFQVQDQVSAISILTGDAANKQVLVGSSTSDANAVLLVLDSYNQSTDPTGVDGAMYYNSATQSFRCRTNGAWVSCLGGMRYSQTNQGNQATNLPPAGDKIASTAVATDFTADTYTVPANDCTPGRVYRINAGGVYSALTGAQPFNMKIKWGSTVIAETDKNAAQFGFTVAATNENWWLDATITCFTVNGGGATAAEVHGLMMHTNSSNGPVPQMTGLQNMSVTPQTITTNSSQAITLNWKWGNSSASNSITLRSFVVEALGP